MRHKAQQVRWMVATLAVGVAPLAAGMPPVQARLPDITSGPRVVVAGRHVVAWSGALTVSDSEARDAKHGVCRFAVRHEARNVGSAPAGTFSRRWHNQDQPGDVIETYPSLAAGAALERTDTLALKPGVNHLLLGLNNLGQVKEANQQNNVFHLTVTVNGGCAGSAAGVAKAAVGPGGLRFGPKAASTARVPAVPARPATGARVAPRPTLSLPEQQQLGITDKP
jgi:hypothetical protein